MQHRTRTDLYLWSGNGDKSASFGSGEVRFHNMRPRGYAIDPSKYHGCVIALANFASLPMTQVAYNNFIINTSGAASSVHFQIVDISQPNSISNFTADAQGVSTYSSNARVVQTLKWESGVQQTDTVVDDNIYSLGYVGTDPLSEGIYTTSPLESFTVRLIDCAGNPIDLLSANSVQGDASWFAHLVMYPILRDT